MKKTIKEIIKGILALSMALFIIVIAICMYKTITNKIPEIGRENETLKLENEALQTELVNKDFQYGALIISLQDHKTKMADLETTLEEFDVDTYETIIEYCCVYIFTVQKIMDNNNVIYPDFIIKSEQDVREDD